MSRLLALGLTLVSLACGDPTELPPDSSTVVCPTHDRAQFELGTGETSFVRITDEGPLAITSGPQGGCHFFVAVRTDGFAERRLRVEYEVFYADGGESTGSASVFTLRLEGAPDHPGQCQALGITAFLIQPWKFENQRVRLAVTVTDDEGRTATEMKTVIAEWPSTLGSEACGPRT